MGERKLCYGCMERTEFSGGVCPNCGYYDNAPSDPSFIIPGTKLNNRYIVGVTLSVNGEGITYLAYDQSIGCKVYLREYMPPNLCNRVSGSPVISVIPARLAQYKALMAEFTELHKSLARLRGQVHVNTVVDLFAENNTTYVVDEYIQSVRFVDYLKDNAGELTWGQLSHMLPPLLTTLSLLHNSGVVHRAISPDTIYVTDKGELLLTAFSIAAVRTANTELECEIYNGYAAPEQYSANGQQGTWTDVYAVCAVIYRVLTGSMPPSAISRMENDNLVAPAVLNPNIPRHVSNVIMQGLNLNGTERTKTVTELVTRLFDEHAEEVFSDQYAAGQICWQEYEVGDTFDSSKKVKVQVSKGSATVEIPSYSGSGHNSYGEKLDELNIPYTESAESSSGYSNGSVIRIVVTKNGQETDLGAGDSINLNDKYQVIVYYAYNPEPETTAPPETEPVEETTAAPAETVPEQPPATEPAQTAAPAQ